MASSSRRRTTVSLGGKVEATIVESSKEEYDVFLNFRGEDTRNNIVDHLWLSLREAQIKVFMDEPSLRFGEEIEGELLAAIERSKIAITIISEAYASSAYCLKELARILECNDSGRLMVIPIFYKVNPSDIRRLENSFQRIRSHAIEYDGTIFQIWKNALIRVGNMKGLVVNDRSFEGRTVRSIVKMVKNQLTNPCKMNFNQRPQRKRDTKYLVGIDERAEGITRLISKDTNRVVTFGICGTGGIGKTTLAKCVYDQIKGSFEFRSFATSSRHSLSGELSVDQLISIILERGSGITNNSTKGMSRTEQFLYNKKVFIVLDDIDSGIEVGILMRMCRYFKSGSVVMFTTRNLDALTSHGVEFVYEVSTLSYAQSMQFLSHHAFGRDFPPDELVDLTKFVVDKLGRLPLLLEVIGSSLFGKERVEWEITLKKLVEIPDVCVQAKLLLCYEALDDNEKQLFLDIAFFPNGFNKQSLFLELDTTDTKALDTLEAMSLVMFDNDNKLYMHDLLRDLSRDILRAKSTEYHNGLWSNDSMRMLKASKLQEDLESRPLNDEVVGTSTQLDEQSCFLKVQEVLESWPLTDEVARTPTQLDEQGCLQEVLESRPLTDEVSGTPAQFDEQSYFLEVQIERNQTTTTKAKEPMVDLNEPWIPQHDFGEPMKLSKFQRVTPEVPLHFSTRTRDTPMVGCRSVEAETSLRQPIAPLDRLLDEINSMYKMEEKLPFSTQEAISFVESFIKQINLPNAADIDFTSQRFLQAFESLRQPNALHEVPKELMMAFYSALSSFARTPEYLDQIKFAKSTINEIQNLKFELGTDEDALQVTQREIALMEARLTSLKAKECCLNTKLANAISRANALSDEWKRCTDQLLKAPASLDNILTLEENVKTNHQQVLQLLQKIENFLKRKTRNRYLTSVSYLNLCLIVVILVSLFVGICGAGWVGGWV